MQLSLTGKRWQRYADHSSRQQSLLSQLLHHRGIDVTNTTLCDPTVYPDMQKACRRVHEALSSNEHIGIFGDYDCDGVTAVAQLVRFFNRRNVHPWIRLPHRIRDGYGLSSSIVDECNQRAISLLITADTGIASYDEIVQLSQSGIDVIVTDHHQAQNALPPAYAILHPALSPLHPLPYPSGSGVALQFVRALEGTTWQGQEEDFALAMFGTVGDLVPLTGGNRILTQVGLSAFQNLVSGPLAELRNQCIQEHADVTSTDIAFRIAPRINAAGRMDDPTIALRALLHGGNDLTLLDSLNTGRQHLSRSLYADAVEQYSSSELPPALVLCDEHYPAGIVGLIAGKLTEQFGRPSLVAHREGDMCVASLRSPSSYNIAEGLHRIRHLLVRYGGHAQAAGCTFYIDRLPAITHALYEDITQAVDVASLVPSLNIDAEISLEDLSLSLCEELQTLQPYGQGNSEPLLLLRNVALEQMRICGRDGTHLQARIGGVKCIGFDLGKFSSLDHNVDVIVRLSVSEWMGKRAPEIVIVDIAKPSLSTQELVSLP